MVSYYYTEQDLVSLQLLLVLNLANIFIMFFMFFIFMEKDNNIRIVRLGFPERPHILGNYQVNFSDILNNVNLANFPDNNEKCSICLEEFLFSDDESVIKTHNCNHYFHESCIKQWLRIRTTCPNCQSNLVARYIENL